MTDPTNFPLIMISAMYENGGNVTQRHLDGHPELYVYPFESQLGTSLVNDEFSSLYPYRYRWPQFPLQGSYADDFELIFDEELKTRARSPLRSKFRDASLELDETDRKLSFVEKLKGSPRSRAAIIGAFFEATFLSWKTFRRSGLEHVYVGYSPIVAVDTEQIFSDFPNAHIVHVVRNPFSAYAETKRRPFPLSLKRYAYMWAIVQLMALSFSARYSGHFHLLRYEDLIADPERELTRLQGQLGLSCSPNVHYPSWNGTRMEKVYPWGTIEVPTPETNLARANELTDEERSQIRTYTAVTLEALGYRAP